MRKWSEAIRDTRFYLSFRVARPTSTRITVMIQKRTITRGSGPALEFKVVVNRRHAKHAAPGQFEGSHLDDHRQGFHHEHTAHDEQHDFLANDHRDGAQGCAQRQCADVAHEDLRGVGVETTGTPGRHRSARRRTQSIHPRPVT